MPKKPARKSKRLTRKRKKGFSWKRLKFLSKLKKRIKLTLFAILAVGLATLAVTGVTVFKFLKAPLTSAGPTLSYKTTWDGQSPFNLLIITLAEDKETSPISNLTLMTFQPGLGKIGFIVLPVDVKIELPLSAPPVADGGSGGKEPLEKVYALGSLSSFPGGTLLSMEAVRGLLAVPLDNYLLIDQKGAENLLRLLGNPTFKDFKTIFTLGNLTNFLEVFLRIRSEVQTDLESKEMFLILKFLYNIRSDKIVFLELEKDNLEGNFDSIWQRLFLDPKVVEEGQKILILNGTKISGLAARYARFVKNLGGYVLDIGNTKMPSYQKSLIVAENPESYTAQRVGEALGILDLRRKLSEEVLVEPGMERANTTIILGRDKGIF